MSVFSVLWSKVAENTAIAGRIKDKPEILTNFDTEYDQAKVPPYSGNGPRPPLVV